MAGQGSRTPFPAHRAPQSYILHFAEGGLVASIGHPQKRQGREPGGRNVRRARVFTACVNTVIWTLPVFNPSISYQLAVLGTGTGFYHPLYSSLPASPPLLPTTCHNVCFGLPPDIENNLAIDENCATAIEKRLCVIATAHEAIWSPKLMSDG